MSTPEFYFNVRTGHVEDGRQGPWGDLMGPYPTREAAQQALETAARHTADEDERDREWNE